MKHRVQTVYAARLAGTPVFDPIGEKVGSVYDVVVLFRLRGDPLAVGLVVEVAGRRRVFLPLTRVTSIHNGQVITTGLVNIRRFSQRPAETARRTKRPSWWTRPSRRPGRASGSCPRCTCGR